MTYRAVQGDARESEDAILAVWHANPLKVTGTRDVFRWYYRENPAGEATPFLLEVAEGDSARTVGSTGVGPRALRARGGAVKAALLSDFFVDRAHRSVFPALLLQRAALTWAKDQGIDVAYGFPNRSARGVLLRLGLRELGRMVRYTCPLRLAPYAERWTGSHAIGAFVDRAVDRARTALDQRMDGLPRGLEIEEGATFDERFDSLWARSALAPITGRRDARFLQWRFSEKPGQTFETFCLTEAGTGALLAYAVLERQDGVVLARDMFAESVSYFAELLAPLKRALRARGANALVFAHLGSPAIARCLLESGFHVREAERTVLWMPREGLPEAQSLFANPASWHLTDADEDQ